MIELTCSHRSKPQKRLLFVCEVGGNYTVDLCQDCEISEDMKFLIKEMPMMGTFEDEI